MVIAVSQLVVLFVVVLVSGGQCLELNQKTALVNLGNALGFLGWNDTTGDPCGWYGIVCSNVTLMPGVTETRLDLSLATLGLAGSLSKDIGNITSLRRVLLSKNELVGPIPYSIAMLPNLEVLDLSFNKLTGPLPASVGTVSQPLKSIYLHSNALTESIPLGFGNLPSLQTLNLANNNLSGPVFGLDDALTTLLQLKSLDLGFNNFSGNIPVTVDRLGPTLESLILRNNLLSGPVPTVLGALSKLNRLDLQQNNLSGPIPTELENLQQLESFMAGYNQLSGPLPSQLGLLPNLTYLSLESNQLTGVIPSTFRGLTKLTTLNLGINNLTGPVPSFLGDLVMLQNLALGTNNLEGLLPPSLGNLQSLTYLYLNNLKLSGGIPTTYAKLTKLFTLYLQSNLLNGTIPDFSQLASVNSLYLSSNFLTGALPISMFTLPNLTDASFNDNFINEVETILTDVQVPNAPWSIGALQNNCLGPTFPAQPQRDDSECRSFYTNRRLNWTSTSPFVPRLSPPFPPRSSEPTTLSGDSAPPGEGPVSQMNPIAPTPWPIQESTGQKQLVGWAAVIACILCLLLVQNAPEQT